MGAKVRVRLGQPVYPDLMSYSRSTESPNDPPTPTPTHPLCACHSTSPPPPPPPCPPPPPTVALSHRGYDSLAASSS